MPKIKTEYKVLDCLSIHDNHKVYIAVESVTNFANGELYDSIVLYCTTCEKTVIAGHLYDGIDGIEVENFQL